MFQIWWAYYQCEPFGSHWEQTANLSAVVHAQTCLMAAVNGIKTQSFGVVDFMPADSMKWRKRSKHKTAGIKAPKAQAAILLQSFGFRP